MRMSALFGAKNSDFLKFIVCPLEQVGRSVEPVRTFCGQGGRRSIFRDFVRTSFMDGSIPEFNIEVEKCHLPFSGIEYFFYYCKLI